MKRTPGAVIRSDRMTHYAISNVIILLRMLLVVFLKVDCNYKKIFVMIVYVSAILLAEGRSIID